MNASVLVVDDDSDIRETISSVLTREGCRVTCSDSISNTLEYLEKEAFDVVITDIRMPGKSGIEFLEQIRAVDAKVDIIVLTGFITVQNIIKALRDARAADYLTKPLNDMEDLLTSIRRVVARRKAPTEMSLSNR